MTRPGPTPLPPPGVCADCGRLQHEPAGQDCIVADWHGEDVWKFDPSAVSHSTA